MSAVAHTPTFPTFAQAVQHLRRLRGGAQAQLLRADDGHCYVVKFPNNPQHIRVLANELLATRLAQRLGLPVPEPAIIDVPDALIESNQELCCSIAGTALPFSGGQCFGSRHINDSALDYLPDDALHHVQNLADFARILILDKWLCNSDGRQGVFHRPPNARKYRVTFIDHGYCLNAGEWTFPDSPLRGVYGRNRVYEHVTGWTSFQPTLDRAMALDIDDIHQCTLGIPTQWCGHDRTDLNRIVERLHERRSIIPHLVATFRQSSRTPFPNWTNS